MTKRRSTKRALLLSLLSLLLCASMLVGSTFAWFTDSVTSANNIIMSGNLDVELEYAKVENGQLSAWNTVKGKDNIFDKEALWEPGRVEVVYLKVSNLGSLALTYQLGVNIISEIPGVNVAGETFKLSDHLVFKVVNVENADGTMTTYTDRQAVSAAAGTEKGLKDYNGGTTPLYVGESDYVALIVYMPTSVGNEANYRGIDVPTINLGINLFATQLTSEYDSFGPDYDADATGKYFLTYGFNSEADLLAFAPVAGDAASSGLSIKDGKAQIDKNGAWYEFDADLSSNEYVVEYDIDITNMAVGENVTVDTGEKANWGSTPTMLERGSTKVYYGTSKNEAIGTLEGTLVHVTHSYSYNKDSQLEITTTVSDGVDSLSYTKTFASAAKTTLYWDIYFATEASKATMDDFSVKTADVVVDSGAELLEVIKEGGTVVLGTDVQLAETLVIPANTTAVIDLNGKNIVGAPEGALVSNEGNLTIKGGKLENTKVNGGATISNTGTLVLDGANVIGAPIASDAGYPSYAITNSGNLTVNAGTNVSADRGCMSLSGSGTTTINGGNFTNNDIAPILSGRTFTSHVVVIGSSSNHKLVINGGNFDHKHITTSGGVVINNWSPVTTEINGGNFKGGNYFGKWDNLSDYGFGSTNTPFAVKGGTFTGFDNNYLAEGYAVAQENGIYTVYFPQASVDNIFDNAQEDDTITVPAGTFTFPASKIQEGMTVECAPGTVFEGTSSLNVKGATVTGATFKNTSGYAVSGTINGVFKDCVFDSSEALRWCYAEEGKTIIFENCEFKTNFRGFHFDDMKGDVIFRNCKINGFNAYGGDGSATFENCEFGYDKSSYNGLNIYSNTTLTDCTFTFVSGKTNFIDTEGVSKYLTVNNCKATLDGNEANVAAFIGGSKLAQNTVTVDGATLVASNDGLTNAVASGKTEILLANGEYDLNGNQKDGIVIEGIGDSVMVANTTKYASGKAIGAIWKAIDLRNVTVTNTVYTMADGGNASFTDVYFAAGFRNAYGKSVSFTNCAFGSNTEGYALHFQSDASSEGGTITLTNCTFEGGKVHLGSKRAYAFTNCEFAEGTDFQVWSNITLTNCTVKGETVTAANVATLFPNLNVEKVTF